MSHFVFFMCISFFFVYLSIWKNCRNSVILSQNNAWWQRALTVSALSWNKCDWRKHLSRTLLLICGFAMTNCSIDKDKQRYIDILIDVINGKKRQQLCVCDLIVVFFCVLSLKNKQKSRQQTHVHYLSLPFYTFPANTHI